MVAGSTGRTIPVATTVVAVPMTQCPHMGTYSSCSMMMMEKCASGLSGGSSRTEHMQSLPRGSKLRTRRRPSSLSRSHARFSSRLFPGGTGTPPTMTRVAFPSVWESTVWMERKRAAVIFSPLLVSDRGVLAPRKAFLSSARGSATLGET